VRECARASAAREACGERAGAGVGGRAPLHGAKKYKRTQKGAHMMPLFN